MNKIEYDNIRTRLLGWMKSPEIGISPLSQILLDPTKSPTNTKDWLVNSDSVELRFVSKMSRAGLERLDMGLNKEQVRIKELNTSVKYTNIFFLQQLAVTNANNNAVSIIMGPPGTGKTHTICSLALKLSLEEEGKILLCAPSNFAADAIASTLEKLSKKYKIDSKILRIYSKSKEKQFCMDDIGKLCLPEQANPHLLAPD
jgi:CRISPR/Cas system-associated endonuclease/helicase Cas3